MLFKKDYLQEEIEVWHILPVGDTVEHEETSTCSCFPLVEKSFSTGSMIIIHNSFDGRELIEEAKSILDSNVI